ncbi:MULTISPECIES: type II toxin-antitoxin system RelE/ParE family toxin [Mucilaginibacter]|jgi:mRNA-degrading endonuclease RelE of RelBE toxin-antitoxin system|uniref:ParE toxin of type II toxin-antitoxin system, parDE n=1 Tax=Mucilaginibacter gossypiicola TaxID=551995 RepID=A0A1H8UNV4_9SPHI|nr:ParE toxin of type II toxin-antitoxin system, parDE [Mucilaginibacter gossypiicola]
MFYTVEILLKAQVELLKSLEWYDEQLEGLGDRLEFSVLKKINSIANHPLLYPSKKSDFRECKVDDFPFLIVYKVNNQKKLVTVYSIFHTSRRPGKKYRSNL